MNQSSSHSGYGITSIALGALAIFVIFLNVALWLVFKNNDLMASLKYILVVLVGLNIVMIIIGLANGIKGLKQKGYRKLLPGIGTVLNLFALSLYAIGIILVIIRKI